MDTEIRVLIADDESIIREGIKCLFDWESLGYTIAGEAANGETAYQQILALQPDIVLLDIRMPGMNGLELQRELLDRRCTLPVVVITGHGDVSSARDAFRADAIDFLEKPLTGETLRGCLKKWVKSPAA